jgi:hypothetical protein
VPSWWAHRLPLHCTRWCRAWPRRRPPDSWLHRTSSPLGRSTLRWRRRRWQHRSRRWWSRPARNSSRCRRSRKRRKRTAGCSCRAGPAGALRPSWIRSESGSCCTRLPRIPSPPSSSAMKLAYAVLPLRACRPVKARN